MYGIFQSHLTYINILCIYGITIKKKKSWKQLLKIIDKLNTGVMRNSKSTYDLCKLISIIPLILCINLSQLWYLTNRELTFINVLSTFMWILAQLKSLGVLISLWKISNIITKRYSLLSNIIKETNQ